MNAGDSVWILVADKHQARLLQGQVTAEGRPHLEECAKIEFVPHAQQHPPAFGRTGSGHSHAVSDHEPEEEILRFARQVAGWLDGHVQKSAIRAITLFATGHVLGALRKELPAAVRSRMTEREAELTQVSTHDLLRHPGVAACFAT